MDKDSTQLKNQFHKLILNKKVQWLNILNLTFFKKKAVTKKYEYQDFDCSPMQGLEKKHLN